MRQKRGQLFNLIVSHEPGLPGMRRALREVEAALGMKVLVFDSPRNLLLLKVDDPFKATALLRERLPLDTVVLRAVPLDSVAAPYLDEVAEEAAQLFSAKARPGNTFAIRLEGHLLDRESGAELHKQEAIRVIAKGIDAPVNLTAPDILVLVKVVRVRRSLHYAGIMVAPPSSIFSRARRAASG